MTRKPEVPEYKAAVPSAASSARAAAVRYLPECVQLFITIPRSMRHYKLRPPALSESYIMDTTLSMVQ
jgi:hypothetical protein